MSEPFKILIDRLKGGHTLKIEEVLDPSFLGPNEPELCFNEKVKIRGKAYLTDDHLILQLTASTKASMPCVACNKMIDVELKIDNFYHTEPLNEIPSAVFDFSELMREALLIELPRTVECNHGNCPERESLAPYLRSKERSEKTTHLPFADMDDLNK